MCLFCNNNINKKCIHINNNNSITLNSIVEEIKQLKNKLIFLETEYQNFVNTNNCIKIVGFGKEDISKIDLSEAMEIYLESSEYNIISNMLMYINFNNKYLENNNIFITDKSRNIVKIHNGDNFICKNYNNIKNDILYIIILNIRKIIDNFILYNENNLSIYIQNKLKINNDFLNLLEFNDYEDNEINKQNNNKTQIKTFKNIKDILYNYHKIINNK